MGQLGLCEWIISVKVKVAGAFWCLEEFGFTRKHKTLVAYRSSTRLWQDIPWRLSGEWDKHAGMGDLLYRKNSKSQGRCTCSCRTIRTEISCDTPQILVSALSLYLVRCSSDDRNSGHAEKFDLLIRFAQHVFNLFKVRSLCCCCLSPKLLGRVRCGSGACLQQRTDGWSLFSTVCRTSNFLLRKSQFAIFGNRGSQNTTKTCQHVSLDARDTLGHGWIGLARLVFVYRAEVSFAWIHRTQHHHDVLHPQHGAETER